MGFVDVGNNSGGCDVLFILRIADGVVVAYSHDEYGLYIGESGKRQRYKLLIEIKIHKSLKHKYIV